MASAFDDTSAVENEDFIGVLDGREAVGDDKAGAVRQEVVEGFLNEAFGGGIHAGGCFIENQDWWVLEEGAGDRDTLFLTNTETDAAFSDGRVKPLRKTAHEIGGIGCGEDFPHFVLRGIGFAHTEVVGGGAVEEETFLADEGDSLAEGGEGIVTQGASVEEDFAACVFVEAEEEVDERGLACACGADEGDGASDGGVEVDIVEDGLARGVGELHVAEFHLAAKTSFDACVSDAWFERSVQNFKNAVRCGATGLEHLIELVEASDGFVEEADQDEKCEQHAEFNDSLKNQMAAIPDHQKSAQRGEESHARAVNRPGAHDNEGGAPEGVAVRVEAEVFAFFCRVGFDLADSGDVVVEEGVEGGGSLALTAVAFAGGEGVSERSDGEKREGEECHAQETDIIEGHEDDDDEDLQNGDGALLDTVNEDTLHGHDIFDQAGHYIAGGAEVEPAEGEILDMGVEVAANVEDDFLLEVVVEDDAEAVEQFLEEKRGESGEGEWGDDAGISPADAVVNNALGGGGEDDHHEGAADCTEEGGKGEPAVAAQVAEDAEDRLHFRETRGRRKAIWSLRDSREPSFQRTWEAFSILEARGIWADIMPMATSPWMPRSFWRRSR